MKPERWWSIICTMGLFVALAPLSAQAEPHRPFTPQPHRQAFHQPQPRNFAPHLNRHTFHRPQYHAFANGWNRQPHRWQQPRRHFGWHGPSPQWHQPRYGWNGPHRWPDPRGNAYGWHRQDRQWNQPNGQAHGWNGDRHQQQAQPNGGHYPGSFDRPSYAGQHQSPGFGPPSALSPNSPVPAGQTGGRPDFRHPVAPGNPTLPQDSSPAGVI